MAEAVVGDPGTWEAARELGKQLIIPVGPYEARVPTPEEFNAVVPYIINRSMRFCALRGNCGEAELNLAHVLGINVPRQGFPLSDGYSRGGYDWEGFNRDGQGMDGFNRDGYNYNGYDRNGFNKAGRDAYGQTREQKVAADVAKWSDAYASLVAVHVAQLYIPEPAVEAPKKVTKKAATKKDTAKTPKKAAARKAVPRKVVVRAAAPAVEENLVADLLAA
jgi:hypothetical protein